jgi:hypothetical protein
MKNEKYILQIEKDPFHFQVNFSDLDPNRRLLFALLERALIDIFSNYTENVAYREYNYRCAKSAYIWLMYDPIYTQRDRFCAEEVCSLLGINLAKLRKLVRKRVKMPTLKDLDSKETSYKSRWQGKTLVIYSKIVQ